MLSVIFNFFVVPTDENVEQLTHEEIEQILAENEKLLQAVRTARADLASAYGQEFVDPLEVAPTSFLNARAIMEAKTGSVLHKFFTN